MEKRDYILPLAPHKTFLSEGFAIIVIDDINKLIPFYEGKLDAWHISSIPPDTIPS